MVITTTTLRMNLFNKAVLLLVCFLLRLSVNAFEMVNGDDAIHLKINKDDLLISDSENGFSTIRINEMVSDNEPGAPDLPGISRFFSGFEPQLQYEIRDSFVIDGIRITPQQFPQKIDNKISDNRYAFVKNCYYSGFLPSNPVSKKKVFTQKGVTKWKIDVVPFRYNHINKKLTVYSDVSVYFSNRTLGKIRAAQSSNPDSTKRSLIITVDDFNQAADTLKLWHLMQGFEAEVITRKSWTISSIDSVISQSYASVNTRPSYVTLIGDLQYIPSQQGVEDGDTFYTDLYYYCMDGKDDYMPDIASGRIPAVSNLQALKIIQKIKNFGLNPPSQASFYTDFLACSYFEDSNPKDGYDDRSFSRTANDVVVYLDSLGYRGERIFFADENVTPLHWNNDAYDWGNPIPEYLLKPDFAWNGTQDDIISGFNKGTFFVLHYDHGYYDGWKHPAFYKSRFSLLTNAGILPFVLSINCYTGEFHSESFAKELLRMENGGALGVIAASGLSYSGYNDGLIAGIIDAIWPQFKIKTPKVPDPVIEQHPSFDRLGDILMQGLPGIIHNWSDNYAKYSCEVYHLFGDPVTQLFTKKPDTIVASIPDTLIVSDSAISLSWLQSDSVTVAIVSTKQLKILGKLFKTEVDEAIRISEIPTTHDVLIVITGHNKRPLLSNVSLKQMVNKDPQFSIIPSGYNLPEKSNLSIKIEAHDNESDFDSVACRLNEKPLPTDKNAPFEWNDQNNALLRNLKSGKYVITCTSFDSDQGVSSETVNIIVYPGDSIYLPLEGNVQDSFGLYNGVSHGGISYEKGFSGFTAHFNGIDAFLSLPSITKNDFTISFCIKTDDTVNSSSTWKQGSYIFDNRSENNDSGFCITINNSRLFFGVRKTAISSKLKIVDDKWHSVAVTRNGNTGLIELYIDGEQDSVNYANKGTLKVSGSLYIGASGAASNFFTGNMDNIFLINRVLDSIEIVKRIPVTISGFSNQKKDGVFIRLVNKKLITENNYPQEIESILFDMSGRLVINRNLTSGKNVIDCSHLAKGLYFFESRVQNGRRSVFRFFIF